MKVVCIRDITIAIRQPDIANSSMCTTVLPFHLTPFAPGLESGGHPGGLGSVIKMGLKKIKFKKFLTYGVNVISDQAFELYDDDGNCQLIDAQTFQDHFVIMDDG